MMYNILKRFKIVYMCMCMFMCCATSTGSPVNGDVIRCFDNDTQLVFTKGPCESLRIGKGKYSFASFNYYSFSDINLIIKDLKWKEVKCTKLYQIYYIITVKGTCTFSTNNQDAFEHIYKLQSIINSGFIPEENMKYVKYNVENISFNSFFDIYIIIGLLGLAYFCFVFENF